MGNPGTRWACAAVLLGSFTGAHAEFDTAGHLYPALQAYVASSTDQFQAGYAVGFVSAATDAAMYLHLSCPPQGVSKDRVMHIVYDFFRANPDRWAYTAWSVVDSALINAFPCK